MTNDRFIPDFRFALNGSPAPAAMRACVTSVTNQNGLEGADRVEIALVNENLRWLDEPSLKVDNELTLCMGYAPDPLNQMFVGNIVGQTATFPSSGVPTLTIAAQDARQRLQTGTRERWFAIPDDSCNKPMPDLAIAGMISGENALVPSFDPIGAALSLALTFVEADQYGDDKQKAQKAIRKQVRKSDFEFLTKLCRENGWEMLIEHDDPLGGHRITFMTPTNRLFPDVSLAYGKSLLEFSPRFSKVGQLVSVTVFIWISELKLSLAVTVGWDWDRSALKLTVRPQTSFTSSGPSDYLVTRPLTPETAPRCIIGELIPRLNKRLTASGSAVGDPSIRAGGVMRIDGVGTQFGGLYRIVSATHTIDAGGYRTSFDLRKEIWFGDQNLQPGAIPKLAMA